MRMRHRRAERCLQRAHVALEAGLINESAEAFEEAQRLNPSDAGVTAFAERLSAARAPVPHTPDRRLGRYAAIAAILLPLSGLAGWWMLHRADGVQETVQTHADTRLEIAAPVNAVPAPPAATAAEIPAPPATVPVPAPDPPRDAALSSGGEETVVASRPKPEAPSIGTVGRDIAERKTDPAPPLREAAPPAPAPLPTTELVLPPSSTIPSAPPAPSPAPIDNRPTAPVSVTPVPSAPDQRAAIRSTLGRYEAAYSELDVAGVRAVWPALDQRALARAFGSLESQRVSLENCNVEVDGGTARANCSGTAAWTPKVGGGVHTSARRWVFDLTQSDGSWRIVRVQAR